MFASPFWGFKKGSNFGSVGGLRRVLTSGCRGYIGGVEGFRTSELGGGYSLPGFDSLGLRI